MAKSGADSFSERVLVLAPTGRDAQVIGDVLRRARIEVEACKDMGKLIGGLRTGAGMLLVAEESLTRETLPMLLEALREQPSWSDIPIVISTSGSEPSEARTRALQLLEPAGNITVLDRPLRIYTLFATIQTAIRARRRQYEARELLVKLRTQTAQLEAEKELRDRFVSVLAHDLRGPLSAAKMSVQILLLKPETLERRMDLCLRADRNLDRAEAMIRDLLDTNRIQAGERLPLRIDECDLSTVCRDVIEELNLAHGPRLRFLGEEKVLGFWSADELRRALWNLAYNAIKYGARDTPIQLVLKRRTDGVELGVHNQGPPIPPEEQRSLFEPFRRTVRSESGQQRGWGLGLTIVRGCAEAHGGSVSVESGPDHGTTFTLLLPWDARPFQSTEQEPTYTEMDGSKAAGEVH